MIQVQFNRVTQWAIRTPKVVRYMEKQFVDAFFESGALRLSSFEKFSDHPDEQRADSSEGKFIFTSVGHEMTTVLSGAVGGDTYILCASQEISNEAMQRYRGCDDGIVIDDTTQFAVAICEQLPGLQHGLEGPCIYNGRKIRKDDSSMTMNAALPRNAEGTVDMGALSRLMTPAVPDAFFCKGKKHSPDREYRFIFAVSSLSAPYIDIHIPNARAICRRLCEVAEE